MAKKKPAVEWYLPGKKKPFAYSTISESDGITILLHDHGNLSNVLIAYNNDSIILSENEVFIIKTFVDHGEINPTLR